MNQSAISWTEKTWNPVFGCTKVSAGCDNCYAERIAKGFGKDFSKVELKPYKLKEPIGLKESSMIFVNSMSDLFHSEVPDSFLDDCFTTMMKASQHTYQILTKRPLRMFNYQRDRFPEGYPKNVWVGTSVENHAVVGRMDLLRQTKGPVRFVSFEPLIGSIMPMFSDDWANIDWAIDGGESDYKNPRPADPTWFREIRDACETYGIAYFHKQNGGKTRCSCHKVWGCELLDGKTYHEYPRPSEALSSEGMSA